jgi:hypothetical protein
VGRVSRERITGNSEVIGLDGAHDSALRSVLTAGTFRSVGLEALFTRHAILPIEMAGCATFPPEHVQSDSTNGAFAAGRVWFDSFLDLVKRETEIDVTDYSPTIQTEPCAVSAVGIVFFRPRHAGCRIPAPPKPTRCRGAEADRSGLLSPGVSDPGLLRLLRRRACTI